VHYLYPKREGVVDRYKHWAIISIVILPNMTVPMSLLFALGILLQVYFFIGNKLDLKKIRLCLMITGVVSLYPSIMFYTLSGLNNLANNFLLFYILIFPLPFSIIFHKETFREIDTTTIISCTILFWFVFLNGFYQTLYLNNVIAISLFLTSIYIFYILLFIKEPNNKQMQTLLGWSLFSLISLVTLEFWIQKPVIFIFNANSNYLDNLNFGMIFMCVAVYGWHLIYSSFYERRMLISTKNSLVNHKISSIYAMTFIIIQLIILIINYHYQFISDYMMITLWLIILPQACASYSQSKK